MCFTRLLCERSVTNRNIINNASHSIESSYVVLDTITWAVIGGDV